MQASMKFVFTVATAFSAIAMADPAAVNAQGGAPAPGARGGGAGGRGGGGPQVLVWAPKPTELTPYVAPNRPHWKLSDVRAMHAGQNSWRQPILRDLLLESDYVQMAPGESTGRIYFGDDPFWFMVWDGQVRVTINGVQPFVASKGFMVQIRPRVDFTVATEGNAPSLHYEMRVARAPVYHMDLTRQPPAQAGLTWYQGSQIAPRAAQLDAAAAVPTYSDGRRVYVDFMKEVVAGEGPFRPGAFVSDDRAFFNVIRGRGQTPAPPTNLGHFHTYGTESWFIAEGQIDYLIEGIPELISAFPGDIVTAAEGRFHRASSGGEGQATRIATNGYPQGLHVYQSPAEQ
jgi:mannose-6-phosphate isomerase-like protein (cupin superfamily)